MARSEGKTEEPGRPMPLGSLSNLKWEEITILGGVWESDGSVVAGKRGNARGAKGPYMQHANVSE